MLIGFSITAAAAGFALTMGFAGAVGFVLFMGFFFAGVFVAIALSSPWVESRTAKKVRHL
jgi:hypothetical protein